MILGYEQVLYRKTLITVTANYEETAKQKVTARQKMTAYKILHLTVRKK